LAVEPETARFDVDVAPLEGLVALVEPQPVVDSVTARFEVVVWARVVLVLGEPLLVDELAVLDAVPVAHVVDVPAANVVEVWAPATVASVVALVPRPDAVLAEVSSSSSPHAVKARRPDSASETTTRCGRRRGGAAAWGA
jgi:hypothetical protein